MCPCLVLGIDCRLWRTRHGRCTRRGTTHSSWTSSRDSTSLSSPVPSVARWDQGIPTLPGDYLSCLGIYLLWEFPTHSRDSLSSLGISTLSRNSPYRVQEFLTLSRDSLPCLWISHPLWEFPTLCGRRTLFIVSMKSKNM